ncbi:MAG TPA: hypothetical protein ENN07_06065 [candidate division Zixibacteria bacterium]|nr:hypothetical protein [candidate division Zixibacteria bacterium]
MNLTGIVKTAVKIDNTLEDVLLSNIGVNTPLEQVHNSLPLPRAHVERIIDDLIEKKLLVRQFGKKNEVLLDRLELLERFPGNGFARRAG